MPMEHIDTALLVGCCLAILSHAIWTFKNIQEIRGMLFSHENESERHIKSEDLVFRDVCSLQVKRFEEKIAEVKYDVQEVKTDIKNGFNDIKELIKAQK